MKVLLTKPFFSSDIDYMKDRLAAGIDLISPERFDEETIAAEAVDADVLLGGMATAKILESAKNLKFIQVPWTGVDNLDFDLLSRYNITICNSHSNSEIVAEHAVALMMDAAKKISYHDRLMRLGNWNRPGLNDNTLNAFSKGISGAKVAIIGFGSIGKNICKMLSGFNCSFKVFNREARSSGSGLPDVTFFSADSIYNELHDVDFVFLTVPLTQKTKGFADSKFFEAMSEKAVLINVSRGEVINEHDLYSALRNNIIGFAAIDTWFNYPDKTNPIAFPSMKYEFHKLENVSLSPHRAGFTNEGFPHLDDAIDNLNRCSRNEELINIISLNNKY